MSLPPRGPFGEAAAIPEIAVADVVRDIWRRKLWVIVPTALATIAAIAYVQIATPRFKSEARVIVERTETAFTRPEAERNQVADRQALDAEAVASQVQLMMSADLARKVIADLRLTEKPEFNAGAANASLTSRLLAMTGLVPDASTRSVDDRVLEAYFKRLAAYPVDGSRVIVVEFQSQDRALAADVANAIVDGYIENLRLSKQEATRDAGRWLAVEIEDMRQKVAEAESKVEAFRASANLFDGPNNTSLGAQQLGELNTQITLARAEQTQAQARAAAIRGILDRGGAIEASEALTSELLRRLGEQRALLRAQRAEMAQTLLDRHPRIRELTAQIGELDAQFRAEALRLVRSAESEATIAAARADELSAQLDNLKQVSSRTSGQEVELRALEREARAQRDLLEAYLGRWREALARESEGATPPDARIISRATPSTTPFSPKGLPTVLIALLGSFFVSTGMVAAGVLHRSGRIAYPADAIAAFPPPVIKPGPAASTPLHGSLDLADPIRRKAGMILFASESRLRRHIVVTTAPGHTTVARPALLLARALAENGAHVALVDTLAEPDGIARQVGLGGMQGLEDHIAGNARLAHVIYRDPRSRLHVVPAGSGSLASSASEADRFLPVLTALGAVYDHVIIAVAPTADETIANPLASIADLALLVEGGDPAVNAAEADRLLAAGFAEVDTLPSVSITAQAVPETLAA